ncbi:uncharacterized protein EI97DRAFT_434869 [Westerdykella ornata]|uniref:MHD domain-containing protein n=1 Tax=Westerdykella ornata TaxID=318751 RepID=A0A6A6JG78_WESOR|nr:uncharacterized protein EI97DRAFT_434869 [Westerdykella ornata]KAF2274636.1 hypothetical protein EI97DRAFT_434869 [Westerdykella ornata]
MELQRNEYPALLEHLPPAQAVNVLNDRMRHINLLNTSIADWLQERRRVEDLYVQGLQKLANRRLPEELADLGIFSTPWQKIVGATESFAKSHQQFAYNVEADVERPLREFSATDREVHAMSTITGNLSAMAKEIETAKKKSDKLRDKGAKAQASKVANAVADVENATSQWESQAPFVFEKLQAVDESRCNLLRSILTQFQTHEADLLDRNRTTVQETVDTILNIEIPQEIATFVSRTQNGGRKPSAVGSPSRHLAPPSSGSTALADDDHSTKSGSVHEVKHGGLSLKRFGTVLGRRRQSHHPYGRASSPERKSSTNLGSAFGAFGKGKSKDRDIPSSSGRPVSPLRRLSTPRDSDVSGSPQQTRQSGSERTNGVRRPDTPKESAASVGAATEGVPDLAEPISSQPPLEPKGEPKKDSEGFSLPPSTTDAITQAEREAAIETSESNPPPQFKLDIRNAPIQEEEDDADAALVSMANTLRAQAAQPRRSSTLRGRRDVRNTIFVPNPATPELTSIGETVPRLPASAGSGIGGSSFPAPTLPAQPASPPFTLPHRTLLSHDHPSSDTQSIMSGRSLSSAASTTIKHADLHEPGLNASIVEAVSTTFEQGNVAKARVIGEVALAYNPVDISAGPFGTENIHLDNFSVLEKVATNPVFIEQVPDSPGDYTVDLSKILKTSVAFKYQLHLDADNLATFAPLILSPAWKVEPTQTSAILHYSLNPEFNLGAASSITLRNLVLVLRLEPGVKAASCLSKPTGTFFREKGFIYWRLGDVTFTKDQPAQVMRARFFTEGEAKPGNAEARWEISGAQALSLGSGLGVSQEDVKGKERAKAEEDIEKDPFADEDAEGEEKKEEEKDTGTQNGQPQSKRVPTVKKIVSGKYDGVWKGDESGSIPG